jgi:hypothetical protein
MIRIIVFWAALLSCPLALGWDIYAGSITHHLIVSDGVEEKFKGKIANNGRTIANTLLGVGSYKSRHGKYISTRIFMGQNSIHEFMAGAVYGLGYATNYLDYGIIVGGYGQNNRFYRDQGISNFAIELGSMGIVPIIGGELVLKYPITPKLTVGLVNVVTPALTNHSLLVRYTLD